MKKIGVILSILTVLTLSFITNNNVSAASDISVTYNSVPSNYQEVFPTCTGDCLNSYSYLIVEINSPNYSVPTYSNMFRVRFNGSQEMSFGVSLSSPYSIYKLPFNGSSNNYLQFQGNLTDVFNSGITFTLTESYQSGLTPEGTLDVVANGTYDVTNYASVDVQVEESSFIVQLFSQGFWGVATAIVTIIVPIIALFLIFRLVHDLLWGRG